MSFYCYAMVHFLCEKRCCCRFCCCFCCCCAKGHGGAEQLHSFNAPHIHSYAKHKKQIHTHCIHRLVVMAWHFQICFTNFFSLSLPLSAQRSLSLSILMVVVFLFRMKFLNFCAAHLSSFFTKINVNTARASMYVRTYVCNVCVRVCGCYNCWLM